MAQRSIRECDGKRLLLDHWETHFPGFKHDIKMVLLPSSQSLKTLSNRIEWLRSQPLVVKPDMLFGKRGLHDLVYLKSQQPGDITLDLADKWVKSHSKKPITLNSGETGKLTHFIVEPFVSHTKDEEFYLCASSEDDSDVLYFSISGGIDIEKSWDKVIQIEIPLHLEFDELAAHIGSKIPAGIAAIGRIAEFAARFYMFFKLFHFSYLELNPFVFRNNQLFFLDLVARVDDTAGFLMSDKWGNLEFPTPFGLKPASKEEKMIKTVDENSSASLKLTVLNPDARIWTLVAGGGASVVYADTIADLTGVDELANYGEYSGNPTTDETYTYASTIIDLMTRKKDAKERDKILIIGGAIANFTDVAKTFEGIIKAFKKYNEEMKAVGVRIYVRRGGPNYRIGLDNIEKSAKEMGLWIDVHGPETHLTEIVHLALKN
ncbi:MAG: ATPase [Candidatus Margulisbacteria bacterium]|nr:ATPase [Candidatus Margulisiibacteriota bacterium]